MFELGPGPYELVRVMSAFAQFSPDQVERAPDQTRLSFPSPPTRGLARRLRPQAQGEGASQWADPGGAE
jgi:hypothetical protein